MMGFTLFDDATRFQLFPFTRTRPVADIRCGILTARERWERLIGQPSDTFTEAYLQTVFPLTAQVDARLCINGAVLGEPSLATAIMNLKVNQKLVQGDQVLAARLRLPEQWEALPDALTPLESISWEAPASCIRRVWDIFSLNGAMIRADFNLLTQGRSSAALPEDVTVRGREQVFLEAGAAIGAGTIINATTGPVYIGKDAEILEGCLLRGPIALGDHAVLKMGAKVYADTTIGPGCKVGGEVSNVVFFANSNKGHDGFLGNAVVGEWCNLGADTNASNLKNNYDQVKIHDEHLNRSVATGLSFVGLLMGDHSKCGINTMFNTGTVVGVSCNIYGSDFPHRFIPSFSWGGSAGMKTYAFDKAMDTARRMMKRRNRELTAEEVAMYRHAFETTEAQREFYHRVSAAASN